MGELSVEITDEAITIVGEMPIKLPKKFLNPELVKAFCAANYNLQGSVGYQPWLAGVFAGLAVIIGPDGVPFSSAATAVTSSEETPGLTPPGSPEASVTVGESTVTEVVAAVDPPKAPEAGVVSP